MSLVVCVRGESALLRRLLAMSAGCFDELIVVHDGPEQPEERPSIREIVQENWGRFFVRKREFQQEPHWPFAWAQAQHDWILRLDADEFPSASLQAWLCTFRAALEPSPDISGYTCIWPLWDGTKALTKHWPNDRNFLFHRRRVRFFGMVEQVPVADNHFESLPLILEHRPPRRTYGLRNVLFRQQAHHWRRVIAQSLLGKPTDLSCWRWDDPAWPPLWEKMRCRPLTTAVSRLLGSPPRVMRDQWKIEGTILPGAAVSGPLHHALICLRYRRTQAAHQRAIARRVPNELSKRKVG